MRERTFLALVAAVAIACVAAACKSVARPADLNPRADTCSYCRMFVSDARFASQIVVPGDDPKFFDDLACLRSYLDRGPLPAGAVVFVADHRTREWAMAETAVYAKLVSSEAPMGSRLVAHASTASRSGDPEAASAVLVDRREVLGR